jgi:hypothetical protein
MTIWVGLNMALSPVLGRLRGAGGHGMIRLYGPSAPHSLQAPSIAARLCEDDALRIAHHQSVFVVSSLLGTSAHNVVVGLVTATASVPAELASGAARSR